MPFLTLRRFRFRRKSSDSDTPKKTPTPEPADPLTFNVLNLVAAKPKRTGSTYRSESRGQSAGTDRSGSGKIVFFLCFEICVDGNIFYMISTVDRVG